MNVLFIVLNEVEYLDQIMETFMEIGVKGATILDSQGMGRALSEVSTPMFGALRHYFDNSRPYNKTIFTVIEDEELLNKAINSVKSILGDITKPGVGLLFTLPVANVYGLGGCDKK